MAASTDRKTIQDIYQDFEARRTGLLKAFTEGRDKFLERVTNLRLADGPALRYCLFGLPDGSWRVEKPSFLPQNLPKPVFGTIPPIPDNQEKMKEWWFELAMQADSWLLEVALFYAYEYGCTKSERSNLFDMINQHPTIVEIIERDQVRKQSEEEACDEAEKQSEEKALDQAEEGSVETALHQAEKESEKEAVDVDQAEKESEKKTVDQAEKEPKDKALDQAEKEHKHKALDQAEKESEEPSSSSNSSITSQTMLPEGGDGLPFIELHFDGPLPSLSEMSKAEIQETIDQLNRIWGSDEDDA